MSDTRTTLGPALPTAAEILHVPSYLGPFNAGWRIVDSISPRSRHYTSELAELQLAKHRAARLMLERPTFRHTSGAVRELVRLGAAITPAPIDTGHEHAPAGCTLRVRTRTGRRGWILTSTESGALSLVQPARLPHETRRPWRSWHPSAELRSGWGS